MKHLVCLAFFLAASGAASAQSAPASPDSSAYAEALARANPLAVISVNQQDGRYVYDLDGGDETGAFVLTNGAVVARSEVQASVMVILEPYEGVPATFHENAYLLTPEAPSRLIRPREATYYDSGPRFTAHQVRVLVCTSAVYGERCSQWTEADPLSGGDGLVLYIVDMPQQGSYNAPPPSPPIYGEGGGRQKTRED